MIVLRWILHLLWLGNIFSSLLSNSWNAIYPSTETDTVWDTENMERHTVDQESTECVCVCVCDCKYEGHLESKERFAIKNIYWK